MTTPKMGDPTDTDIFQKVTIHRSGNWTLDEWLAFLTRQPFATLPSGAGKMLAQEIERLRKENASQLEMLVRSCL